MKNNKAGFETKKSLGQNFLQDDFVVEEIAKRSGAGPKDLVVEIGPGLGVLTDELAPLCKKLIAVELDDRLIPILRSKFALEDNVEIVHEDILRFNWDSLPEIEDGGCLRIVGNLPYYITTPILLGILNKDIKAKSISVMVQKEVADRIVASPGGKEFGVLSASLQYYADCELILDVPKECFNPKPKVDSAVVNLYLKEDRALSGDLERLYFELVKKAFSQRRKTLLNSLCGFRGLEKQKLESVLNRCNINPQRRAETLSIEEYINLTKEIQNA